MTRTTLIHTSDNACIEDCSFGEDCVSFPFCNLVKSHFGNDVNIGAHVEVYKATVGNNVRIGASAFICEGVEIGDNVFIGPHVCFTNDKNPSLLFEHRKNFVAEKTIVCDGANIGANVTILPGLIIGEEANIGAGSVVTKDVPMGETWCGNPARKIL